MKLEELFKWNRELVIIDSNGKPVMDGDKELLVYQRVLGDSDIQTARKKALAASRDLRRQLRSGEDDVSKAMIPEYELMSDDELVNLALIAASPDLRQTAISTVDRPIPPLRPGNDASIEELENYETAIDEHNNAVADAIDKLYKKVVDKRRKELARLSRDELLKHFMDTVINTLCQAEMVRVFNEWCTYLGTYSNKRMTKRAFDSFEVFSNCATELKDQIVSGYIALEIGGEDLKN